MVIFVPCIRVNQVNQDRKVWTFDLSINLLDGQNELMSTGRTLTETVTFTAVNIQI